MESITHITRRKDLLDHSSGNDISLQEWMSFVYNDPEMRLDNTTTVVLPGGETYKYDNPGAAVFLCRETGELQVKEIALEFIGGSIVIKDPNRKVMDKIRHIAFKLNARIFKETKATTFEIPSLSETAPTPRFSFENMLNPVKKPFLALRSFFQHIHIPFTKSAEKNSPVKATATNTPSTLHVHKVVNKTKAA